jgi:alpha-beta hydrolase superfamily lysophospholipase
MTILMFAVAPVSRRTQVQGTQPSHHHPVILCPGLGSSGAYSFDLSPNVSLADYLASKGWDVWTCELRGGCRYITLRYITSLAPLTKE